MHHFIEKLFETSRLHKNEPAISDEFSTFSYGELIEYASCVTANLMAKGVKSGDRIIVEIPRSKEYGGCLIGCWLMGAVAIPLSDDYPEDRLNYIKEDSKFKLQIDESFIKSMDMSLRAENIENSIPPFEAEGLVIYTSGSTGNPKGVVHDFYSISEVSERNAAHDQSDDTERNNIVGLVAPFTFIVGVGLFISAVAIGKHLYIVPDEIRRDPFKLAKFYDDNNIESSFVPPRLVDFMLANNKSLKVISVGSERITNLYFDDNPVVINGYGSTELFGGTLAFKIDRKYENTPIGVPFGAEKAYVLDDDNNEVTTGELCISGYVAKGYLNRPEETKKAFIKNPFKDIDGYDRMFRTGDIVERLPDGNLVFVERKDWMIKINGQRVEPLEVESTIRRIEGIKEVAIKDFCDKAGVTYLAAYYVCDDSLSEEDIRQYCKDNLTSYMVPAFYIKMDKLPVNPNGKLDRIHLPEPDVAIYKSEYKAPENKIQEAICKAMEEVLKCGEIGIEDDFFLLGGNSIKAIQTINLLDDLPIDTETFLTGKTPKEIARLIENGGKTENFERVIKSEYSLTSSQLGVYFAMEKDSDTLMYNNPVSIELGNDVDIDKFVNAVEKSINNHGAYHCNIDVVKGVPCMVPNDRQCVVLKKSVENIDNALKDFVRPFDLKDGELIRAEIFDDGKKKVFALDGHHIVFDGTTLSILLKEIEKVYEGRELFEEKTSAFDLSTYEEYQKTTDKYKEAEEFFDSLFDGLEISNDFPQDYEDENLAKLGTVEINISPDRTKLLKFIKENGITENTLFLGAFSYVLAIYNGTKNSLVSVGESGRHTSMTFNTAGMLVKTLALPIDIKKENNIADYLRKLQGTFRQSVKNDLYPFSEIAAKYGLLNDYSFVYQGDNFTSLTLDDKNYQVDGLFVPDAMNKLTLMVFDKGDSYRLSFRYRADLFSEDIMKAFADAYGCAVEEFISKELLKEVDLLSDNAKELCDSFCDREYDIENVTIAEKFNKYVKAVPDKDLVVYKDKHVTYGQAGIITDKIAQYIVNLGLKKQDAVSILIPRSEWMVLAFYGTIKAGCTCEPLDPSYPSDRLSYMVENAGAKLLITTHELVSLIPDYKGEVLYIENIEKLPDASETIVKNESDDTVFLLYTSGTTGKAKGVQLTHGNVSAVVQTNQRLFGLDENTVCACYASFGFDMSFDDIASIPFYGGTLHIVPEEIRLDIAALDKYYTENRITHALLTTQVGRQFVLYTKSPYLKYIGVGGEALVPLEANNFSFKFYNMYGPTESTFFVSQTRVLDKKYRSPIGVLNENVKGYIVDENMRRLPVGAPGELVVAGVQVSKGYLNMPEKTQEVFVDNPFCDNPRYKRMYRTGDVVRFLPNGILDFIGRHDGQVKVRGFRIELTEVEEVIRRFEGITDATVAAFDEPAGGKYLAAYVVSSDKVDEKALRNFISSEKPPYMVPSVIMQIDKIPLNQNQKVNKRALPKPERKLENVVLPENQMQQTIYDICCKELGHSQFGIDTNLFEAGLTSIGIIRLNVELDKAFNVSFKVSDINENNTVQLLEQFIASADENTQYEILEDYPLTQTQMGIYIECSSNPEAVNYNIPMMMKLDSSLDIVKLAESIKTAINAHPYTKAILFADKEGNIRAKRDDNKDAVVNIVKCEKIPDSEELVKPFKLLGEPLYRITIFETADGNYLFMDFHHIASDGTSENIILADISKAYEGKKISKERYSGFEFALDEEKNRASEEYEKAKEYYDSIFKGCDADCLPPKAPEKSAEGAGVIKRTANTFVSKVTEFCRDNKFTLNAYFNAAFGYTLSFFENFDDSVYTTIYNGRSDSRLAASVTMLVKTLPVLVHTEGSRLVKEIISETQEQLLSSMSNDIYSFAEISAAYGIRSDIIFAYQGSEFTFDTFCGHKAEFIKVAPNTTKSPITITVFVKDGKYELNAEYMQDRYSKAFINSFLDVFDLVLNGFTQKEKAEEINVLSDEAAKKISEINNTSCDFDHLAASMLFEKHAHENPDKTAVVSSADKLTYKELNERANRIAAELIRLGVKKDSIVGILLNRTVDIPVCELAILKAGGAFLPILPEYPDDRIDFCLKDSESKIVLTTEDIKQKRTELFSEEKEYKVYSVEELAQGKNTADLDITPDADALSYCIYTSGSTGKPKGVMIEQHCLSNFVQTFAVAKDMFNRENGGNVGLAFGSISFDIHIIEILLPLCNGKTVVLATEDEVHNPAAITDLMVANKVDVMACTPSFIMNMLGIEYFEKSLSGIKSIMVGAENFPAGLFEKLTKVNPDIYVVNAYGPTECAVSASSKHITDSNFITIGGPAWNYQIFIMDKFGRKLPMFATGELIIAGEGVGRGYINLPEKNRETFIEVDNVRAYRSGDVARYNDDGELEFSGRMDNQVKLRGYRVELDEIENAICDFEGIKSSKVVVRNNGAEDYLVAFFTAADKIDVESLTAYLKTRLTYYMVPDIIMQLDVMPLTPSGKIDKKALPEVKKEHKKKERKAPKKSLEQQLCDIFAQVLSVEEFYADDNFFEMGGTSLSASKVIMQLQSKGYSVEYQNIFDNPTPETLSESIEASAKKEPDVALGQESGEIVSVYPEQLKYNIIKYADNLKREPLGNVLLTGAVGFLGIHILSELIKRNEGKIICLLRRGKFETAKKRLMSMLMYYFDNLYEELMDDRILVVEADVTEDLTETLKDYKIDTIINSAAIVKHYAADDSLEKINVGGVENLIKVAQNHDARLVQISTISIPGVHTQETYNKGIKASENKLFVIDDMGNKYNISKYHAELKVLEAVKNGMKGKIVRVGNLMGRYADGEFQINFRTNAFLNSVRGFATIGKSPVSHATDPMRFSPVDQTAEAIVLLAGTNDMFTAFNADNRFGFDEWQLIEAANKCGVKITPVPDEEYYSDYHRMLGDPKINARLQGLMTNDRPDIHGVETENKFTANILYRLGFSWTLPDKAYIERVISGLVTLGYFDADNTDE